MEAPRSFTDAGPPQFPAPPDDFYSPCPLHHVAAQVSLNQRRGIEVGNVLQLAWALVLSEHTSSLEVIYGLSSNGPDADSSDNAVVQFCWQVDPRKQIHEALARIASQRIHLQKKSDDVGTVSFGFHSADNVVATPARNLLAITHVEEAQELISDHEPPSISKGYALSVHCEVRASEVQVLLIFDVATITESYVQMLLLQFIDTIEMIYSSQPGALVQDLQQMGPEGLKQVCHWNSYAASTKQSLCVHEKIESHFKDTPNLTAVAAWDGTLTYHELDKMSLRVATQIIRRGIKPAQFVGIITSKSVLAVVGMVAVMRAGGAFLFLPPTLPSSRLRIMCQRTPVDLVLTVHDLFDKASDLGPMVEVFGTEETENQAAPCSLPATTPDNPLYAIYTSGSTGEPKGVVVNRGAFGPGVTQYIEKFGLSPGCRIFQSVPYAFVVSIIEQLMALASGACICVPSEEQLQNHLEESITAANATIATMTPSVARTLTPSNLTTLKTLVLAGEPVTQSDLKQWSKHIRLCSLYGQSETASSLLIEDLSLNPKGYGLGAITTGACWIVRPDDHTKAVPIGGEGELMIESTALGSGYRDNADENAKTFIAMPKWLRQLRPSGYEGRCLLTGDIVRYSDTNGTIRLVGRKGTGAKIRGQRVELGEVESQLRALYPGAKHVIAEVVQPARSAEGQSVLVAFISGIVGDIGNGARLVAPKLREVLPSYMIPSAIIPLTDVPTTATGKAHRKTLREKMGMLTLLEILSYNYQDKKAYRPPANNKEKLIQSIVEELLCLSPSTVSLEDSFFDVGGDSLTARQLVAKARSHGLSLTVAAIYANPILSALAESMGDMCGIDGPLKHLDPFTALTQRFLQSIPTFLHDSIGDVYPSLGIATRTVHERRVDYFPFALDGPLDRLKFQKACETFIDAVPIMRSVFVPFEDQLLVVTLRPVNSLYQELTVPEGNDRMSWAKSFIAEDRKRKLSFERPCVQISLICKSVEEHIVVLRLPHAVYDGGCLQQIGKMLSAAYNGTTLPAAPTFADYARAAANLRTPEALNHWTKLIEGSEITRLPRASNGEQDVSIFSNEMSPAVTPPGITLATAIKAAWAWVLHLETGKTDILFGQVGSMRGTDIPEGPGSDIIGCCLNTTPLRVCFEELKANGATIKALFDVIHDQHVQGLPYETVDWSDVVAQGMRWPRDTELDSVVLHENFGSTPSLQLGDILGEMDDAVFAAPPNDQHMLVTWPGKERLTAFLVTRKGMLASAYGEQLVALFCRTLTRFLDSPETNLFVHDD